ncbi:MAG: endolytic transglycosylase MltG [Candidatus Limnocylindria bacterium]
MAGPLVFVLVVLGLAVVAIGQGQAIVGDVVVGMVEERDTLLRQGPIRSIVAARVGPGTDLAADPTGDSRDFVVADGETAGQIARRLEEERLVRSALAFLVVVYEDGVESDLHSGPHRLSPAMTPREISAALSEDVQEEQTTLRLIEGWRLTEVAAEVEKAFPHITAKAFEEAAVVGDRTSPIVLGLDPATSLEGYLFPDTYFFLPDATAEQIIDRLVATFDERAGQTLLAAAQARGTTPYDLVKLASLVEREARARDESATIAGVYANRLAIEMKLDADPTIQYALGEWRPLLLEDLQIDSPYNTYLVAGLPPTPICNPGLAALQGAAEPEEHEFFFFVADESTGRHLFATTLEEHEANRVRVGNR